MNQDPDALAVAKQAHVLEQSEEVKYAGKASQTKGPQEYVLVAEKRLIVLTKSVGPLSLIFKDPVVSSVAYETITDIVLTSIPMSDSWISFKVKSKDEQGAEVVTPMRITVDSNDAQQIFDFIKSKISKPSAPGEPVANS